MPRRAPKQLDKAAATAALLWIALLLPLHPAAAGAPSLRGAVGEDAAASAPARPDGAAPALRPSLGTRGELSASPSAALKGALREQALPPVASGKEPPRQPKPRDAADRAEDSAPALPAAASGRPAPRTSTAAASMPAPASAPTLPVSVPSGEDAIAPPAAAIASAPTPTAGLSGEDAIARPAPAAAAAGLSNGLMLAVTLNSQPAGKIVGFTDLGDGHLAATRRDLEAVGVRPPGAGAADEEIPLDGIADFSYIYDPAAQRVDIVLADSNRIPNIYDARGVPAVSVAARSDYGAVLNYSLFAAADEDTLPSIYDDFSGVNASLEARVFTPVGVVSQTGIAGDTATTYVGQTTPSYLRLDTTYTYDDDENLIRYRAGDVISGGPLWSRPVRLGGIQAQRTFSIRPDLVTQALPSYSGSAAVPSTVDVYVNNAKAYSKEIAAGPFQLQNLPVINGAGDARVVVRDAAGRETEESISFYTAPTLLKPGLVDFSAEAGLARQNYGIDSSSYGENPIVTGSIKAGITEHLSAEAHAEGGEGLVNGGGGAIVRVGSIGVASAAVSGSVYEGKTGIQLHGSFDTRIGPVPVYFRSQRAYEDYEDLASLTAYTHLRGLPGLFESGGVFSLEPPRAVDSIGLTLPIGDDDDRVAVNFVHYETVNGDISNLLTASYSRPLTRSSTFSVTGFADIEDRNTATIYAGVNMSLDDDISLFAGATRRNGDLSASVEAKKSLDQAPGSWGWQVRDYEGTNAYRSGDLSYRARMARLKGGVRQDEQGVRGTVEVEGAVAAIGGGVYATNRIDDSFAVVDAGAPGVSVLRENNVIGQTGDDGTLLVPGLNSYHANKLAIDPMGLPLNATVAETVQRVMPAFKSGTYVDFAVEREGGSAIVVLTDAAGSFIEVGSEVTLEGTGETFMVGYDGQTFLTGLSRENALVVTTRTSTCRASFAFESNADTQQVLGPEVCR